MLEIEKRNTCGPTRAGKRHVSFADAVFCRAQFIGSCLSWKPLERRWPHPAATAGPPGRSGGGGPGCRQLQQRLCRRSPIAASAANFQPNFSFRLKCRFGLTVGGGRPALIERPRPTLGPKSRSAVRIQRRSFPGGRRGRAVIREGSMFRGKRSSALFALTLTFA